MNRTLIYIQVCETGINLTNLSYTESKSKPSKISSQNINAIISAPLHFTASEFSTPKSRSIWISSKLNRRRLSMCQSTAQRDSTASKVYYTYRPVVVHGAVLAFGVDRLFGAWASAESMCWGINPSIQASIHPWWLDNALAARHPQTDRERNISVSVAEWAARI